MDTRPQNRGLRVRVHFADSDFSLGELQRVWFVVQPLSVQLIRDLAWELQEKFAIPTKEGNIPYTTQSFSISW